MKRKKKELLFYIVTVVSCLMAISIVVVATLLIYDRLHQKDEEEDVVEASAELPEITYSEEEVNLMLAEAVANAEINTRIEVSDSILSEIQLGLEGGQTIVDTLRPLYPEYILVVSGGRYHFVPIRDDLKQHNLLQENLQVLESGELQYVENDVVVSHKGIDVSRYQEDIDWNKVAAAGVEYAFIRVGIRGWGSAGRIALDEKFEQNIQGATAAGIKVGVYFFSQAVNEEEAAEEAEIVLEAISGYNVTYPIVFDVEKTSEPTGRMNQISVEERTRVARVFVDKIREAGYTPMIYSNMEMWSVLIDMASFEDVEKWFAYYGTQLYFPYEYAVWQYSDKGRIDGITGDVDLNISFKEW